MEKRFRFLTSEYDGKIDGAEILVLMDATRSLDLGYPEKEELDEEEAKEKVDRL